MKKIIFLSFFCLLFHPSSFAQTEETFKGVFYSEENHITIVLNPYQEDILIPNFEFLGQLGGYMRGDSNLDLYGTWMLLSCKLEDNQAVLRFSNDIGSDAQTVIFTKKSENLFEYRASGKNVVKKAIKRKLYPIKDTMVFKKREE